MTADVPALVAFAALRRSQGGALGVVASEGGALLGNLSVSDLRGLRPEHYGALALPVRKHPCFPCINSDTLPYPALVSASSGAGRADGAFQGIKCCPQASFILMYKR